MALHARAVARAAGADADLLDEVARALAASGEVKLERARTLVAMGRAARAKPSGS
ncbi:MAG: hypothetical protein R2939_17075 [Kofleriaceae bacterium]